MILKKNTHILEDGTNGCASGDIEQVTVKNYSKYDKKNMNWWFSTKKNDYDLSEFNKYEKNQVENS